MTDDGSERTRLSAGQLDALRAHVQRGGSTDSLRPTPPLSTVGRLLPETNRAHAWIESGGGRQEKRLPCSHAQTRLWFLEQWERGTGLYHIGHAVRLRGRLDLAALQRSVALLVARHESLRTGFVEEQGEPVQRIVSSVRLVVAVEDGLLAEPGREAALEARLTAELGRPFDLREPPLMRVTVWRLGAAEQVLLLALHHLVSDGWSQGVLNRELGLLYARRRCGMRRRCCRRYRCSMQTMRCGSGRVYRRPGWRWR